MGTAAEKVKGWTIYNISRLSTKRVKKDANGSVSNTPDIENMEREKRSPRKSSRGMNQPVASRPYYLHRNKLIMCSSIPIIWGGGFIQSDPSCKDYMMRDRRFMFFYIFIIFIILGIILPSLISYYLNDYQADLGNCNPPEISK